MTLVIIFFTLATVLVVAEVLFPSFGLLSLLAIGCYVGAIVEAFDIGPTLGYSALAACVLLAPLTIWLGFQILQRTSLGTRLILAGPDAEAVRGAGSDRSLARFLQREGVAASDLRPSGLVDVASDRLDAVSDGDFLAAGTRVRIIQVEGNRVVVAPAADDASPGSNS
jgi:membrane-bound ClpP family serine protease